MDNAKDALSEALELLETVKHTSRTIDEVKD